MIPSLSTKRFEEKGKTLMRGMGLRGGPGWIRTDNQRITSPLLHR